MIRKRSARALAGGLATILLLVAASAAYAAVSGHFSGKTNQGQSISFDVAHGKVTHLQFHIRDTCPSGHVYVIHDFNFPPININSQHKFDKPFVATKGPSAEVEISGTVRPRQVKGALVEHRHIKNEGKGAKCSGRASFTVSKQ